ncbi:hypothetical protein D3C79_235980 [compost metagenome]
MGKGGQYLIAHYVAVRVVNQLEMVDINQQQRHRLFRFIFVLQQFAGLLRQRTARQHPRQKIVIGAVFQPAHQLTINGYRTGEDQRPHHQHGDPQPGGHQGIEECVVVVRRFIQHQVGGDAADFSHAGQQRQQSHGEQLVADRTPQQCRDREGYRPRAADVHAEYQGKQQRQQRHAGPQRPVYRHAQQLLQPRSRQEHRQQQQVSGELFTEPRQPGGDHRIIVQAVTAQYRQGRRHRRTTQAGGKHIKYRLRLAHSALRLRQQQHHAITGGNQRHIAGVQPHDQR